MTEFENFNQLDNENSYVSIVKNHFVSSFADICEYAGASPAIDEDRLRYAHGEYVQSIAAFAVLLDSKNPDQYKRAAALLHSLYKAEPVVSVTVDSTKIDALEMNNPVGISFADAQHRLKLTNFYIEYANQLLAFDLAFRCCDVYEEGNHSYNFDFLNNMVYYLQRNSSLSVASFAMIFKAFMA